MKREVKWWVDRKWGIRYFRLPLLSPRVHCHLVKSLGMDHRKWAEVGGVPGNIEGRHESMFECMQEFTQFGEKR